MGVTSKNPQPCVGSPETKLEVKFAVDWLSVTSDKRPIFSPEPYAFPIPGNIWKRDKAHSGYNVGWSDDAGATVQWHDKRDDMRVQIQYTGQVLTRYWERGYPTMDVIRWYFERKDTRLSRIDLAIDVHDAALDIKSLYEQIRSGIADTHGRKERLQLSGESGVTLYIGAPTSDKQLRIYDKGAERDVLEDWKRAELQVRGDAAAALGKRLAHIREHQLSEVARSLIGGMVSFDSEIWAEMVRTDTAIRICLSQKQKGDLVDWLANQVAPAIARYINEGGNPDIMDKLIILVNNRLTNPK